MANNIQIVIMAGGVGSRLWPLSTSAMPKQFIDLLGVGKTLIQMTYERMLPLCSAESFWVVTSERYAGIVAEQLPDIPKDQILLEPEPRNTAPCIAYASWKIRAKYGRSNILVAPSDAIILNNDKFLSVARQALEFTAESDNIVTIGIVPDNPNTGYGYIHAVEMSQDRIVKVTAFKEKPDLETAKTYLASGEYVWNAGIFVWNADTVISEIRANAPGIADIMDRLALSFGTEDESAVLRELFPQCEKISIDYAVMEKSNNIYVISSDLQWSDLGTWASVGKYLPRDGNGNNIVGEDVQLIGCGGCIVNVNDDVSVIAEGLEGYIIGLKNGNLLICKADNEQKIREWAARANQR